MSSNSNFSVVARGDCDIVMTRDFNAPRALVYRAYSEPELMKRWLLGPPGWEMVVCELASSAGDLWRYEWRDTEGTQFGFAGVCTEIVPPERTVQTQRMIQANEPYVPGTPGDAVVTITLDECDGRTTVTTAMHFESREQRDAVLATGMEHGVKSSYDRLEELLPSLA